MSFIYFNYPNAVRSLQPGSSQSLFFMQPDAALKATPGGGKRSLKRSILQTLFRLQEDRMLKRYGIILAVVCCLSVSPPGEGLSMGGAPSAETITLPEGFRIDVYAGNVPGARSMALGAKGTLFVGTRSEGKVYAVVGRPGSPAPPRVMTIAKGLNMPNGVAFRENALFVAEVDRILRYDDIESRLDDPPRPVVVNDRLPKDRHHGWKFIRFGPDGRLYVPVGAPCNICEREDPRYASIMRLNRDGTDLEIFARGVRNTVGFDWHPGTGELWFTDNGRDWMGDALPPDELNRAPKGGLHFGFPYCHGKNIPDPDFGKGRGCAAFTPPMLELGPHVAALGMRFYRGTLFPAPYQNRIFIAEHGSWNRSVPIGYRITMVKLDGNEAAGYEVFASGWLRDGFVFGRPVDIQELPDGSLLVSDDLAGAVYRISYRKNR